MVVKCLGGFFFLGGWVVGRRHWCSNSVSGSYGMSFWEYIRQGCPTLSSYLKFEVRVGSQVKFWQDRWCGECGNSLAMCFPTVWQRRISLIWPLFSTKPKSTNQGFPWLGKAYSQSSSSNPGKECCI